MFQSLLTVNNNVSLISVNVAPSTYLASFIILIVFLTLYIPRFKIPSLSLPSFPRFLRSDSAHSRTNEKALPGLPFDQYYNHSRYSDYYNDNSQLILQDQSLVLSSPDIVKYRHSTGRHSDNHQNNHQSSKQQQSRTLTIISDHERDPRRPRRQLTGLRASSQSRVSPLPLNASPKLDDRRRVRRSGSPGLGDRFRKWVFSASVAEDRTSTSRRAKQQRLLERTR